MHTAEQATIVPVAGLIRQCVLRPGGVILMGLLLAAVPALRVGAESLATPPVLQNLSSAPNTVEVNLTAEPTRLSLMPGTETNVWAYNGQVPGPTLEVREGDRVIVHFQNNLPEPTTVHWHGIHLPASQDGSPFDPVAAGGKRDYTFTIPKGTAGTYWYHPHLHHKTGYQIAKGLVGAIIVRAPDDPLPKLTERLLILTDQRFRADGSIDLPDKHTPEGRIDEENGREGDVIFVNGQTMPVLSIRPNEVQRWRVINASAARVYRLAIPNRTFLHVGSDGGLFAKPVELGEITVANAERVELLVRGSGKPGSRTALQSLPYDRYVPQTRPKDWNRPRDLLAIQVTRDAPVAPVEDVKTGGRTIMELERDVILSTLERLNGNRTHTAKALGITVRTVRNRLRKYRTAAEGSASSGPAVAL